MDKILELLGLNPLHILFYAINLIVLFVVLYIFLYSRVRKGIQKRKDELNAIYNENDKLNKEALTIKQTYETKLEETRHEVAKLSQETIKIAEEKANVIISDANKQARSIVESAKDEVEAEESKLQDELLNQTTEIGLKIASVVLGREVNAKDNQKLIEDALKKWED